MRNVVTLRTAAIPVACIGIMVTSAAACEPPLEGTSADPFVDGSQCSVEHRLGDWTAVWASKAEDVGEGIMTQSFTSSENCGDKGVTVVMDCNSAKSVVFGEAGIIYGWTAGEDIEIGERYYALQAAVTPGEQYWDKYDSTPAVSLPAPFSVVDVETEARRLKMPVVNSLNSLRIKMTYENYSFDLSCGCRTFYPNSKGASQ